SGEKLRTPKRDIRTDTCGSHLPQEEQHLPGLRRVDRNAPLVVEYLAAILLDQHLEHRSQGVGTERQHLRAPAGFLQNLLTCFDIVVPRLYLRGIDAVPPEHVALIEDRAGPDVPWN